MTLFALKLLQATLACLLAGLLLQGLLYLAQRRWPALAARRSLWLGAQLMLAALFMLSLLPGSAQVSVVPEVSLSAAGTGPGLPAGAALPAVALAQSPQAPGDGSAGTAWLATLALAWLCAYPPGVVFLVWRGWRGRALVRGLLKVARPLDVAALQARGAVNGAQLRQVRRMAVLEIDAPISPMLEGIWRPRLLLPAHLAQFTAEQQHLVIEHELTHARRRDPFIRSLAHGVQALLWFNPAARWLGGKLGWAQELGCDRQVLSGRPQRQRQQYAAALLRQLSLQAHFSGGLAFGGRRSGMADRIARMRDTQAAGAPWLATAAIALVLCSLGAASLALQPALAWSVPGAADASGPEAPAPARPAAAAWRNPLASMRVTGFFGVVRPITQTGLRGLDLAARRGTPVQAVADGIATVTQDDWLGKAVRIAHGGGLESVYAHLDSVALDDGAIVAAGQLIGAVGDTGRATGPHLHFQVRQDGRLQDPQTRLAGLDANASARALRMRKEQFGR